MFLTYTQVPGTWIWTFRGAGSFVQSPTEPTEVRMPQALDCEALEGVNLFLVPAVTAWQGFHRITGCCGLRSQLDSFPVLPLLLLVFNDFFFLK